METIEITSLKTCTLLFSSLPATVLPQLLQPLKMDTLESEKVEMLRLLKVKMAPF